MLSHLVISPALLTSISCALSIILFFQCNTLLPGLTCMLSALHSKCILLNDNFDHTRGCSEVFRSFSYLQSSLFVTMLVKSLWLGFRPVFLDVHDCPLAALSGSWDFLLQCPCSCHFSFQEYPSIFIYSQLCPCMFMSRVWGSFLSKLNNICILNIEKTILTDS